MNKPKYTKGKNIRSNSGNLKLVYVTRGYYGCPELWDIDSCWTRSIAKGNPGIYQEESGTVRLVYENKTYKIFCSAYSKHRDMLLIAMWREMY